MRPVDIHSIVATMQSLMQQRYTMRTSSPAYRCPKCTHTALVMEWFRIIPRNTFVVVICNSCGIIAAGDAPSANGCTGDATELQPCGGYSALRSGLH